MIRANTPTPSTRKRNPRKSNPVTDDRALSEVFFSMSDDQKDDVIRRQLADSAAGRFIEPTPAEQARHDAVLAGVRRRGNGKPRRRFTVRLAPEAIAELDAIAKRHGITRARVVESAIIDLIAGLKQRRKQTDAASRGNR